MTTRSELVSKFFDLTPNMLCILGSDGSFQILNTRWTEATGYTLGDLADRIFLDLVHPDDKTATALELEKPSSSFATRFLTKSGEYKNLVWHVSRADGLVYAVARDTSFVDFWRSLALKAVGIGVWQWNPGDNSVQWDPQVYRLYGENPNCGLTPAEIWIKNRHPADCEAVDRMVKNAVAGNGTFDATYRVLWPDGSVHYLKTVAEVFRDSNQSPHRLLGVTLDVTDENLRRDESKRTQQYMIEQSRLAALGALAGAICHEINNPLAIALASLTRLIPELSAPEVSFDVKREFARALDSSKQIREIVEQLAGFARPERGTSEPILLKDAITTVVTMAQDLMPDVEIRFLPGASDTTIRGPAGRLQQILLNLLTNARDAARPGTHALVTVTVQTKDDLIEIRVVDNGAGISEKAQARIFSPFFSTKEPNKGTGLGLSIARSIAQGMGGNLTLESTSDQGSAFLLTVPPATAVPTKTYGLKAMVADDEESARKGLRELLEQMGVTVREAHSGEEVIQAMQASPGAFDVIFSDVNMPNMNGYQLAKRISDLCGTARPSFFLFSGGHIRSSEDGTVSDVDGAIFKPIESIRLQAALMQAAERKRTRAS